VPECISWSCCRRTCAIGILVVAAACGRYRFDPLADPDGGIDTASACGHTFCDDFDRAPFLTGWDAFDNTGAANLAVSSETSTSAPNAYLIELPAPQLEGGFLVKRFPTTTTSATIAFQIQYTSTTPGTAEIDLVQLLWDTLPAGCTSFGYILVRDGTGPFGLQETYGGCGGNEDTAFSALENLPFHPIVMTVTFGPVGTARVQVDVDGARIDKATSHAIDPSALTLRLGGGAVRDMSAPWLIRYDDVVVDLE